jgi:arabinogalactan oligomer / maltooligosaccharide transport system permease protein
VKLHGWVTFLIWLASWLLVGGNAWADERPGEVVTLRLWHAYAKDKLEQKVLNQLVAEFQRENPNIRVDVLAVPHQGYASKLGASIPLGNGPDVFIDAHERVGDFRERKLIAPLPAEALADPDDYIPGTLSIMTIDKQLYGAPISLKCLALFLNNKLVPTDPQFLEDLFPLQEKLPNDIVVLAHTANAAYTHAPFLSAFGGTMLTAHDGYGMNSKEGQDSVRFVADLVTRKLVPEEASGALIKDLFWSGKAAAAINGPWMADEVQSSVSYRVIPLPRLRATGRKMRPLLTIESLFVTPQGQVKPKTRRLVHFLSSKYSAQIRAEKTRSVSAFRNPPGAGKSDPFLKAFSDAAQNADVMSTSPAMRLVFEPTDKALRKVFRGQSTPTSALEEANRRFDNVRRPLPTRRSPTPYAIVLGLIALAGAFALLKRTQVPGFQQEFKRSLSIYPYLLSAAVAVLVLVITPLVVGAGTSFFAGQGDQQRFVGLAHYAAILTARGGELLGTGSFYLVLLVTLLWTVTNLTLHLVLGVTFGILLSKQALRFKAWYRVLLIIPWAVPSYVTALAWKGMFHQQFGAMNALLKLFGVEPVAWFSKFTTAFAANLSTNVWLGFPFMMVITMGAITSVPKDVLEAAEVDGATRWQRLRLVTLPMIKPVMMPSIAMGAVWTFNMFNVVFLVSGGDPDGSTDILVSEAYRWAFTREAQIGYAAAYAVLIFLLLFGTSKFRNWRGERSAAKAEAT